jgi:hypothetical protein
MDAKGSLTAELKVLRRDLAAALPVSAASAGGTAKGASA